ncbi:sirohydrochlorin chelatase [Gynuella sp.]|uniref:sirohydrochlorin chelatase n=1 Tax=Gynuella sp. TaxID=2969146 RepID=UPI003D0BECE4
MKGLLLVAHGSRLVESNNEIEVLRDKLRAGNSDFDWLDIAFLELASPQVGSQIDAAVQSGVTDLKVFPYFLAAGYHVRTDLPELLEHARDKYPDLSITLAQHLGAREELVSLILKHYD